MNSKALLVNASDVTAQNDMNIKAQNIAITAGEDRVYNDFQSESKKKGFFGRGSKTSDTSDQKTVVSSTISAKNLNINTKTLSIQGSKLTADQAIIASEVIELISLKNSDYESHFSDKSDTMTRTIISKGHIREEVVPALIQVRNQLIINNKDVTNQLQTDNLVKTITSQSGLSVEQIKLVQAYAKSEEWNKQMTSLTGMGSIIIAAIVTVCTMGAGTGLVAAAMEGMNAAVQAAVQAAIQSMVVQATTSLVTAAITGNSPVLDASSLIKGAVTAGVLSYTSAVVDSSLGLQGVKPADMSYTQQLERGVANTVVKSTVNSAVYGTDFGDNLKIGLATDVSNLGFRYVGDTSMSQYLGNGNDYFKDGGIGKVALHSAVGGASAALMGGDVASGAVAAGVNELASPLLEGIDDKRQQAISGLIGGIAAGAVGGESEITRGQTIAQSATEYNRQLHKQEIDFIEKKSKEYAEKNNISPEEAQKILYLGAMYYNNEGTKDLIDKILHFDSDTNENSKYTPKDIKNAFLFLKQESQGMQFQSVESPYYQDNKLQDYFTSTQEQYKNNSLNVPMQVGGMQDESYILVPTTPILKTTSEAGTTIGKATINMADDLYLKTGIKTENYLQNTVVPSVKDGYYGTMNFVYQPENAIKIIGGIEVANDILNESMPPSTPLGELYYLYDSRNDLIDGIKTIYEKIK